MSIGTMFTLFVTPMVYTFLARDHAAFMAREGRSGIWRRRKRKPRIEAAETESKPAATKSKIMQLSMAYQRVATFVPLASCAPAGLGSVDAMVSLHGKGAVFCRIEQRSTAGLRGAAGGETIDGKVANAPRAAPCHPRDSRLNIQRSLPCLEKMQRPLKSRSGQAQACPASVDGARMEDRDAGPWRGRFHHHPLGRVCGGRPARLLRAGDAGAKSAEVPALSASASGLRPFPVLSALPADYFATTPYLLGEWPGIRSKLSDLGIQASLTGVDEAVMNLSGGLRQNAQEAGQVALQAQFDLQKRFGLTGARILMTLVSRWGRNAAADAASPRFSCSTRSTGAAIILRLERLAWNQKLLDDRIEFTVGRLAFGDQFFASLAISSI